MRWRHGLEAKLMKVLRLLYRLNSHRPEDHPLPSVLCTCPVDETPHSIRHYVRSNLSMSAHLPSCPYRISRERESAAYRRAQEKTGRNMDWMDGRVAPTKEETPDA
jgi:hypothetical protein